MLKNFFKNCLKTILHKGNTLLNSVKLNYFFNEYKIIQSVKIEENKYLNQKLDKKDKYKIAFIIPGMLSFGGGHTGILRLGTYLEEAGHEVFYITYDNSSEKEMERCAKINKHDYKGKLLEKNALDKGEFDIGIATYWLSAYYLYNRENFRYKAYLVQDYEPGFFPLGDAYYLSKNTYSFGFHMITLGNWIKKEIEKNVKTEKNLDFFNFPVELQQYPVQEKEVDFSEEIKFAVFIKTKEKRGPVLLFECLELLAKKLGEKNKKYRIFLFGLEKEISVPVGKNMGKLKNCELKKLYDECDFGVCASFSNFSYVPYEMIARGLPVIEFAEGSAPEFFDEDCMIFSKSYPQDFVEKTLYYIDNPDELQKIVRNSQDKIKNYTFESSAAEFLNSILKNRVD